MISILSFLLSFWHSSILTSSLQTERIIQALFLARSSLEEYKTFKKVTPITGTRTIFLRDITMRPCLEIPTYCTVCVTVTWYVGKHKKSLSLSRITCL
ncbi:hypothetical protein H0X06_01845 [Candidatus Dependentiae bacterium]|nr:hypothetical protein [Candidatus Dependentiae bacterium]